MVDISSIPEIEKYRLLFKQIMYMYIDHDNKGKNLYKLCKDGITTKTLDNAKEYAKQLRFTWENPELIRILDLVRFGGIDKVFYPEFLDSIKE
jgi:hypothetical protein